MVHTSRSKVFLSKHHDIAQLSARSLLVLQHGPIARLQEVAIVAGYVPSVQRSDFGWHSLVCPAVYG